MAGNEESRLQRTERGLCCSWIEAFHCYGGDLGEASYRDSGTPKVKASWTGVAPSGVLESRRDLTWVLLEQEENL